MLGEYINGNYNVTILNDGTKIRESKGDRFIPTFPESMDLKITNKCDMGCKFCHENSTSEGLHGDILNAKFIDSLYPHTELALGGGNTICHPDLIPFLQKLKSKYIIPSMTINQKHFIENLDLIDYLVNNKLIYGLGISLVDANDKFINTVKKYSNAVVHIINGIITEQQLNRLYDNDLKILILGYKEFRRGKDFYSSQIEDLKVYMYNNISEILNHFKVVSFDNLAIKQLDLKRVLSEEAWNSFYMGDDGQFTMYVDLVNEEFARSSTSTKRYKLKDNIIDMFNIIKSE